MPVYNPDQKKEIMEVLDAVAKEFGLSAGSKELQEMAGKLGPFYGPDLFRLLWRIPKAMNVFPSADKIIARLKAGPVDPPKQDFGKMVEEVFGIPGSSVTKMQGIKPTTISEDMLARQTAELVAAGVDPKTAQAGADLMRKALNHKRAHGLETPVAMVSKPPVVEVVFNPEPEPDLDFGESLNEPDLDFGEEKSESEFAFDI